MLYLVLLMFNRPIGYRPTCVLLLSVCLSVYTCSCVLVWRGNRVCVASWTYTPECTCYVALQSSTITQCQIESPCTHFLIGYQVCCISYTFLACPLLPPLLNSNCINIVVYVLYRFNQITLISYLVILVSKKTTNALNPKCMPMIWPIDYILIIFLTGRS